MKQESQKAFAYVRTSSAANVGDDKDSEKRQQRAIAAFATRASFEIAAWFRDQAVSGEDMIETRPGFSALLDAIEADGVRTVIVEEPSRFARSIIPQEAGVLMLAERGVKLLTSTGEDLTDTDDDFKIAMRQVAAVFSRLEKATLVKKLAAARDAKRAAQTKRGERPKVEGRRSLGEKYPTAVLLAHSLRRKRPKGGVASLRDIAAALAAEGHKRDSGAAFDATAVRRMLMEENVAAARGKLEGQGAA